MLFWIALIGSLTPPVGHSACKRFSVSALLVSLSPGY